MTTILLVVDLWRPAFHGLDDRGRPTWPVSPWRLVGALQSACHLPEPDPEALTALRALTRLSNPVIHAPGHTTVLLPQTYTHRSGGPMDAKPADAGVIEDYLDLTVSGLATLNRVAKPTSYTALDGTRLVYEVQDPDATVDVEALDRAARRIPYLGRSHDGCDVTVKTGALSDLDDDLSDLMALHPVPDHQGRVRGWTDRTCDWMDVNHELTVSGSQVPAPSPESSLVRLLYLPTEVRPTPTRVAVVPLATPVGPSGIGDFMASLDLRRHLADLSDETQLFPAVFAGHPRADGRMLGLGVAVATTDRVGDALRRVATVLRDHVGSPIRTTRALSAAYWSASAARWTAATPLRAFPDVRVASEVVGAEVLERTGQAPRISWSRKPVWGWQRPRRQPPDGLDLWWPDLEFDDPVTGPLILGASKDLGFGVFVPEGQD